MVNVRPTWRVTPPCILMFFVGAFARAHVTPVQLPAPESIGEAWNVVEQASANIDQLAKENLPRDVGAQLANIAPALRYIQAHADGAKADEVRALSGELADAALPMLELTRQNDAAKLSAVWTAWRGKLATLETRFPSDIVQSQVYICSMHPADRHLAADDRCSMCGMSLIKRRLPASATYQEPGQPTMKLAAMCEPLVVGKQASVTLHLKTADGQPVALGVLLEAHTKKIHLLINDESLSDYHHEHPEPTDVPGDYRFTFTPTKRGPYRVWADLVPVESGVQEYVIADLSADTESETIADRETRWAATRDGLTYTLAIDSAGQPLHAAQMYVGTITIADAQGQPFKKLEPVMGAFAHLVGFNEDHKTVVHIHPWSAEPQGPDDRGGPAFAFKFYAPTPGFTRFYCQVRIDGKDVFVPFNLTLAGDTNPRQ